MERGWKRIFHANGNDKKAGVAVLISDKVGYKTKAITKDNEWNYILIKGSIEEDDVTLVNRHASNTGASKYIKWILTDIEGETDKNIITVGGINTPLTLMNWSSTQKINKATVVLNAQ